MVADTGVILLLLGLSGAIGQVFIFVTISKFGALTCAIIGTATHYSHSCVERKLQVFTARTLRVLAATASASHDTGVLQQSTKYANWYVVQCVPGLARKILTLVASLVIYRHPVNAMQGVGLTLAIGAMMFNFSDKGTKPKVNHSYCSVHNAVFITNRAYLLSCLWLTERSNTLDTAVERDLHEHTCL
jgi:hypothetical protein